MKPVFTLLGLFLAGLSQAQPDTLRMAPTSTRDILRQQVSRSEAQKTTATAYRMTGFCRYDFDGQRFVDSSRLEYSGTRGTYFADEYQNLLAGLTWNHSRPDRIFSVMTQGQGGTTEIAHSYDASNYITESTYRMQRTSYKFGHTYNGAGLVTKTVTSDSGATGWLASAAYFHQYDASGNRLADSTANLLTNLPVSRTRYHYSLTGKLDTTETRRWVGATTSYIDYMLVNTYDGAGRLSSATTYYADENHVLLAGERMAYTYNAASLLSTAVRSANEDGIWEIRDRDTIGYTGAGTLYTYLRQEGWDQSAAAWRPFREWQYQLDGQGRWSLEFFRTTNSSGVLAPSSRMTIDYNAAGLVTAATGFRYIAAQGMYDTAPFEQDRFHYEAYQTTSVTPVSAATTLRAVPNPATSHLRIEVSASEIQRLWIVSATGQHIRLGVSGAGTQQVDISGLPAGVYLLQAAFASGATQQLRFVKL